MNEADKGKTTCTEGGWATAPVEPSGYLPSVKQMVEKYLADGGFDGLYTDDCGCEITDLFPCDNPGCLDCKPGYITATDCGDGTVDFGIGPDKPQGR